MSQDLIAFLAARLDEVERIARAAIDERANGEPESWRWECTDDDTPIDVDHAIASNDEFLQHGDDHFRIGLRSTVDYTAPPAYPDGFTLTYPHLVIDSEELRPKDARHIARHDPARVLREVAAKRAILATQPQMYVLRALAAIESDHPDYRQEWALSAPASP